MRRCLPDLGAKNRLGAVRNCERLAGSPATEDRCEIVSEPHAAGMWKRCALTQFGKGAPNAAIVDDEAFDLIPSVLRLVDDDRTSGADSQWWRRCAHACVGERRGTRQESGGGKKASVGRSHARDAIARVEVLQALRRAVESSYFNCFRGRQSDQNENPPRRSRTRGSADVHRGRHALGATSPSTIGRADRRCERGPDFSARERPEKPALSPRV
jgi:hypothetical protein